MDAVLPQNSFSNFKNLACVRHGAKPNKAENGDTPRVKCNGIGSGPSSSVLFWKEMMLSCICDLLTRTARIHGFAALLLPVSYKHQSLTHGIESCPILFQSRSKVIGPTSHQNIPLVEFKMHASLRNQTKQNDISNKEIIPDINESKQKQRSPRLNPTVKISQTPKSGTNKQEESVSSLQDTMLLPEMYKMWLQLPSSINVWQKVNQQLP